MRAALDIVRRRVDTEGFPVSKRALRQFMEHRIILGDVKVLQYGSVVFALSLDRTPNTLHLYSDGAGSGIFAASRQLMNDIWKYAKGDRVIAPILHPTVMKLAERFGWKSSGYAKTGHKLYLLERPK